MPTYSFPTKPQLTLADDASGSRHRVVIVTNPSSGTLEYFWPLQVFEEANALLTYWGHAELGYDVEVVATRPGPVFRGKGIRVAVDRPYYDLRGAIDTLIFQAVDAEEEFLKNEPLLVWTRRMSGRVRRIASICVGTYVLAEAGVLEGRRATTHWAASDDFQRRYPNVELDTSRIYVKDGNVYSSAGATAALDLAATMVEEDYGADLARHVAQGLVMYLKRPGNQAQFSVHMTTRFPKQERLRELQVYIAENPAEDLKVRTLAERVSMSPRHFARIFSREFGVTPGRFVERSRVERACQWLEQSRMSISTIARSCGYSSIEGLRSAFHRHVDVSPREYRRRFASARDEAVAAD